MPYIIGEKYRYQNRSGYCSSYYNPNFVAKHSPHMFTSIMSSYVLVGGFGLLMDNYGNNLHKLGYGAPTTMVNLI